MWDKSSQQPTARSPLALRDERRKRPPAIRPPIRGGRGGIRRRRGRRARPFVRRDQFVALVPAVGAAAQLRGKSKLYLNLGRKKVIEHVVDRLLQCVGTVVVAVPEDELEKARGLLGERALVVAGGTGYRDTLRRLLDSASAPFVLIHDVSWPFASPGLMRKVGMAAAETGAASTVDHPEGPIGRLDGDEFTTLEEPGSIVVAQSPCAFRRELIEDAIRFSVDDDADDSTPYDLVRRAGMRISPVDNEKWNIRISTLMDWEVARKVLWPVISRRMRHGNAKKTAAGGSQK